MTVFWTSYQCVHLTVLLIHFEGRRNKPMFFQRKICPSSGLVSKAMWQVPAVSRTQGGHLSAGPGEGLHATVLFVSFVFMMLAWELSVACKWAWDHAQGRWPGLHAHVVCAHMLYINNTCIHTFVGGACGTVCDTVHRTVNGKTCICASTCTCTCSKLPFSFG